MADSLWPMAALFQGVIADLIRNLLNVGSCHRPLAKAIGLKIRCKITHFLISSNLQHDKSFPTVWFLLHYSHFCAILRYEPHNNLPNRLRKS